MTYAANRSFSDRHTLRAMELIGRSSMAPTSDFVDRRQGADLSIMKTSGFSVGMRTRKYSKYNPWEFTVRCRNASGYGETEYQKFRNGLCDRFFYGTLNQAGTDYERWVLVNMNAWREAMNMSDLNKINGRTPVMEPVLHENKYDQSAFFVFDATHPIFRDRPILIDCHEPRDFPGRVSFFEGAGRSFFPRRRPTSLFANDNGANNIAA